MHPTVEYWIKHIKQDLRGSKNTALRGLVDFVETGLSVVAVDTAKKPGQIDEETAEQHVLSSSGPDLLSVVVRNSTLRIGENSMTLYCSKYRATASGMAQRLNDIFHNLRVKEVLPGGERPPDGA